MFISQPSNERLGYQNTTETHITKRVVNLIFKLFCTTIDFNKI